MKRDTLPCILLAALAPLASAADELSPYIDSAFGWNAGPLKQSDVPASLSKSLPAAQQHSRRQPGVPTPPPILQQIRQSHQGMRVGDWVFFPDSPQKFMPYLDGIFVPGNTCAEPCGFISSDPISLSAQRLKRSLSGIGLQYDLTISGNYTRITPQPETGVRRHFASMNNCLTGTWFLAKSSDNGSGVFLTFEADWGKGFNFNENWSSAQQSIGSLSNPQGSLRGGHQIFVPNLALGTSLFDGQFVFMVGTLDVSNYLDQNAYSASWSGNLMNQSFNYNPSLPLQWANWGVLTAWQPTEHFYLMYAGTSANTPVNHNPFNHITSDNWLHVTEMGFIFDDVLGMGPGTYRFQYTITSIDGQCGSGAAINFQQQLGRNSRLGFFTRCGVMDEQAAAVTGVKEAVTAGVVLQAPFTQRGWGSKSNRDQLALGFLWERAADSEQPCRYGSEYGIELSAVAQITPTFYLQPDIQYIIHPVHNTDKSGEWVFQIQGVFTF